MYKPLTYSLFPTGYSLLPPAEGSRHLQNLWVLLGLSADDPLQARLRAAEAWTPDRPQAPGPTAAEAAAVVALEGRGKKQVF